jgi:hypothetical protein
MPSQLTNDDHVVHRVVPTEEARQGETTGRVRTVLHISLGLAVLAGVVVWLLYFT